VTPVVEPDAPGFYHKDAVHPAKVTLRLREEPGQPAYAGQGTARVSIGTATLHTDQRCRNALGAMTAGSLRAGVPVHVKGSRVEQVTVELTLADPGDRRFRVEGPKTGAVAIKRANEVTPSITVDQGEGWYHEQQTSLAKVTLRTDETTSDPAYSGT